MIKRKMGHIRWLFASRKTEKPAISSQANISWKKIWDAAASKVKKSYPNSARLNNLLLSKLQDANKTLLDLETQDKAISSKQVKSEITNPLSGKSFNEISAHYIQELEDNKKLTRLSSDRARVKHFIEFAGSNNINFREIDEAFLRRYMTFLKTKKKNSHALNH